MNPTPLPAARPRPRPGCSLRLRAETLALLALALLAGGCDGGPTRPEPRTAGIHLVAGQAVTDTVEATVTPLEVEIRGQDGEPAAGQVVRFQAGLDARGVNTTAVLNGTTPAYFNLATEVTDSRGRASVRVRLGTVAGPGTITVTVPALGFQDTARYTITPGAPAGVAAAPGDSAVRAGHAYPLRAAVTDRHGNPRPGPVTLAAGGAHVSVSGGVLRGESGGRGYVVARSGTFTDTAWVSVVPAGVLAAYELPFHDGISPTVQRPGRLVLLNTDGSEYRVLLEQSPAVLSALGMQPSWSPSGDELAYVNQGKLMVVELSGSTRQVVSGDVPVHEEYTPQYSPDGEWIFFTRGWAGGQQTFWRVRRDGSDARQASPAADWGIEVMPSPSPEGGRLVYQTNRVGTSFTLQILDLATGNVGEFNVPGTLPRWSPAGDWIAYMDEPPRVPYLRLVRPDGSGMRLAGGGIGAHPVFSWSPDGAWLVISGNHPRRDGPPVTGLSLLNVASGELLPIPLNHTLVQPSWRR